MTDELEHPPFIYVDVKSAYGERSIKLGAPFDLSLSCLHLFIRSNSFAPLPATSAYFTTSEPRAKLLTRYHSQHILGEEDELAKTAGKTPCEQQPVDSELLIKKKVCLELN